MINRSPKYSNKYVHHRTSLAVSCLSEEEVVQRQKLGLIRTSVADQEYYKLKREIAAEEALEGNQRASNMFPSF